MESVESIVADFGEFGVGFARGPGELRARLGQLLGDSGKLERMFELQERLNAVMPPEAKFGEPDLGVRDPAAATALLRTAVLAQVVELVELLGETDWKPWRRTRDPRKPDYARIHEEIVDVFHFCVNLALTWGLGPCDLMVRFEQKHRENVRRQVSDRY